MANFGYSSQEGVTFYYNNMGKVTDLCLIPMLKPLPFAQEVPIASSQSVFITRLQETVSRCGST